MSIIKRVAILLPGLVLPGGSTLNSCMKLTRPGRTGGSMPRALLLVISLCLTIPTRGVAGGPRPAPAPQNPAQTAPNPESISPHLVEWMIDINEKIDLRQIGRASCRERV